MKRTPFILLSIVAFSVILAGSASAATTPAPLAPLAPVAPTVVSYQGRVKVGGIFFDGLGYFKFAIVNQAGDQSYWSNDGSSAGGAEPTSPVELEVSNGLFNVLLGDDSKGMVVLDAGVFEDSNCYLRVWFAKNAAGPFDWLKPDRRMAAVPYAFQAEKAKNADTLEGYRSGNASGNVPLSNGALNTNLNADLLDGSHASAFQQHYANVVIVAKSGGDYATITAALSSIPDADDTNRYLVKVMPGVYTEQVMMKAYVDIEGSGELTTRITGPSGPYAGSGTVTGANNSELRFLTVANTGGGDWAVAIYTIAAVRLTHVTASASGATNSIGVSNSYSASTMQGVTASASGTSNSIGVENFNASPTMQNVTASASGGAWAFGVRNITSLAVMQNVTATASGASTANYGVYDGASSPAMQDLTASATGGVDSFGVYNYESSPSIRNSSLSASGGTSNYGVYNDAAAGDSFTVRIDASQVIAASTSAIYNHPNYITRVGASLLAGGAVTGGGTITCAGVYDENYAFSAGPACP